MNKKLLFVGMVLLTLALVALAADEITGKWVFEQAGRGGGAPRQTTLDLKVSGAALTGTVTAPAGGMGRGGGAPGGAPGAAPAGAPAAPTATPISNGKVTGNTVSFEVSRESPMGGGPMVTKYEGTVSGAEMKLKITQPGMMGGDPRVNEVTAKKQ
jgi:hypothetical protein